MKKIYLMGLTVSLALSVNAQTLKKKSGMPEGSNATNVIAKKSNPIKKTSALIWSDDFSNASNWVTSEDAGTTSWTFGTSTGQGTYSIAPIASTSAANGFALFDSDFGCDGDQIANMTNATAINCLTHPNVRLGFQQQYRRFVDSTFIYVSNNGTTWDLYRVNTPLADDDFCASNPDNVLIDISATAGNQATVWVRWTFYSPSSLDATLAGCGYNWMIDDAYIEDIPAVNVQVNALGVLTGTASVAGSYNCNLGNQFVAVQIRNVGLNTESNIPVNYSVNGSISTPTVYTGSIPAGDSAQILMPLPYNFGSSNSFVVKGWTAYPTDGDLSNDTAAIAITNTIPTPLTSTTYTNGIESSYDFNSLNLDWAGTGLPFGPSTGTKHSGTQALFYTVNMTTIGAPAGTYEAFINLPCMDVTLGDTYRISYWKKANTTTGYTVTGQSAVFTGTAQTGADMATVLKPYSSITPNGQFSAWTKDSVDYVATATETRYFAIGGKGTLATTTDQINVRIDDIQIAKVTSGVGVKTIAANDAISIFPNPTSGILNINAIEINSSVDVYNVIGDKVYTSTLAKGNNAIDLSGLANGAYFVKLNSNNQIITKKVVLSK